MTSDIKRATEPMSDPAPGDHRVVVFAAPDETEELRKLLVDTAGLDASTARFTTHALPGLLPGKYNQEQAAVIARGMRELGVSAAAVPLSDVPNLSQARPVHHLRVGDEGLEIVDANEKQDSRAWPDVSLVSIGILPSSAPAIYRAGTSMGMGSTHRSRGDGLHLPARSRPEAFVVFNQASPLLLASDEMNFEYLENQQDSTSTANFQRMMSDIVGHATGVWCTPSTRAYLDRGPVRHCEFRSREDFRSYTEFQALLREQFPTASHGTDTSSEE